VANSTKSIQTEAEKKAADRISVATQWQLMWWRFRKHRMAVLAAIVLAIFYLNVLQPIHLWDGDEFSPHVYGFTGVRDPKTFKKVYTPDPEIKIPITLFAEGYEYKLFGLFETNRHLIGVKEGRAEESIFILGTDGLGRDLFSRLMVSTRLSMTIGLVGVSLSLFLGIMLGGLSGLYGGIVDSAIQRLIEIVRSVPTIPLWMALAAAVPSEWPVERVYFVITLILGVIGWTTLARVVRGRFLSLRSEDFVTAAELAGAGQLRIIFRHMVPSFLSHIIAATTLALPAMIIAETALSFLGLGLRPPAVSWGVLLLAFNFLGDGLRDAADPYG